MFSENRYLTKRIHEELPLFLQLFLWNCIAELPVPKDYLQIFRLSGAGSQQIILHSQEVPPYEKRYQFAVPFSPVTAKIYGNTAQRASGDFARHLLANFPSYFTKMLVNTSSIHSAFCFI